MKSILVTGGTGFVGRHVLAAMAKQDIEVHVVTSSNQSILVSENINWHHLDLHNTSAVTQLLKTIKPSHLLHLAWFAKPVEYWTSLQNTNWLTSSLHLLTSFIESGGSRAVLVGSCAEYDWQYEHCHEIDTPCIPKTLYGSAKYACYLMSKAIAQQSSLSFAWARLFFLFGQYEYADRLIPSAIKNLKQKTVFQVKNGEQVRDFMYVKDVASALLALLNSEVQGPVNIASGKPLSIKQLLDNMAEKLNATQYLQYQPNQSIQDAILTADIGRLNKEVKWQPQYSIHSALEDNIAWWEKQLA